MICVIKIALNICQTLIKHKRFGFSGMLSVTSSQAASRHYPPQNGSLPPNDPPLTPRSSSTCTHVQARRPHLPSASAGVHFDATPRPRSDWRRSTSPPTAPRRSTSLSAKASRRWHLACAVTARSHACARPHLLMCERARVSAAAACCSSELTACDSASEGRSVGRRGR